MKIYKLGLLICCITLGIASCSKKDAREIPDPPQQNRAPVANAGVDQTVSLPFNNTATLDASESTDSDNNIKTYLWTEISGPSSGTIALPNNKKTRITNLVEGVYEFELTVTDAEGLSSNDRVVITVKSFSSSAGCLVPGAEHAGHFQEAVVEAASVVCNDKFYFVFGSMMQIFDPISKKITLENTSIDRSGIGAVTAGNKIFFAGGYKYSSNKVIPSAKVDIYDTDAKTITGSVLSIARYGVSAITIGTKIFFAGGRSDIGTTSRVDIYDLSNNTWSLRELSVSGDFVSAVVNNTVWFVAIGSNKIDIYDAATDSWSTKVMDFYIYDYDFIVKQNHTAITLNNKIYFTGNQFVRVYDIVSDTWSSITLSEKKYFIPAGISNNKIAFIGGMTSWFVYSKLIEIYDPATNSWSTQYMSSDLFYQSIISYDNYIYSAGGLADEENTNIYSICRFQL